MSYFLGVDVGTGSARAALVSDTGKVLKVAVKEIKIWQNGSIFYEQSSEDIWNACVFCIRNVISSIPPNEIKGIGFDATCSLVALDKSGRPLSVSLSGNNEQNIIMWLDHRAEEEAEFITNLQHPVLRYTGKKISLEMETPKLLWLKKNLKEQCYEKAGLFFDLPDFLTWRATDSDSRSLCSLVCKWTYEVNASGELNWNKSYFEQVGLDDLMENNFKKIGSQVFPPGKAVGRGLSETAAKEFGLLSGTPVAASIIDAHAGGLGLIGCSAPGVDEDFESRLSLICGTSSCHMAVSKNPIFAEGIWGPYFSAMVPGMWLNEGGQSVTGKLIDHIIDTHPAARAIKSKLQDIHIQDYLYRLLDTMASKDNCPIDFLTKDVHVLPDFHGNRSPIADPTYRGAIFGLTMTTDEENLAILYLATIQALCYGTKHILETLKASGYKPFKSILICGGLSKSKLFTRTQANVENLPVVCPDEVESVLLGSAILGACAANYFQDIFSAIKSMGGQGRVVNPDEAVEDYHRKKYSVFLELLEMQRKCKELMK